MADTIVLDELLRRGEGWQPERNRLMAALCVATALHLALIIGITFDHVYKGLAAHKPMLEILLIQAPSTNLDNPKADYLAEFNQRGAGNGSDASTARAVDESADSPTPPLPPSDAWGALGNPEGDELIHGTNRKRVPLPSDARTPATYAPLPTFALAVSLEGAHNESTDINTLRGAKSDTDPPSPNTRASPAAIYLNAWRQKIEQIGTTNYPLTAVQRAGLTGNPVLEVQILANGHLGEVRVQRSSGHPELDQAALGILHMAAPFDPFPKELAAQNPTLRLAYEWQFLSGSLK